MTVVDSDRWKSVSEESLRFFGEMSASVSHEIRNKLAVINEKAGLVQDIVLGLKSGRSIDPDRLEVQAGKIIDQIRQANQIVGALNRLAHSVDASRSRIDLASLIGLVVQLYGRKAAQAEITIKAAVSADSVSVITSPFLLQDLIGACIDAALPRVDDSRIMTITAESSADGAMIRFQHLPASVNPIPTWAETGRALGQSWRRSAGACRRIVDVANWYSKSKTMQKVTAGVSYERKSAARR